MKRFNFKFASVEKVRRTHEDEALRMLGDAQRVLQEAKNERAELGRNLDDALVRRENLGQTPTTSISFQTEEDFIRGLKHRIVRADQAVVRASRGVEKAMRVYLNARRQSRMVEVLREQAREQYRKDRQKAEQKEQDDIAVMRARLTGESA